MKIGDRVRRKLDRYSPVSGLDGTVVEVGAAEDVNVRFDSFKFGYSLDSCDWWVLQHSLDIIGLEGASTPPVLPSDATDRKKIPLAGGVFDYFPSALVEVAKVSYKGNEQHNPGQPLHWSRGKSADHADTMLRHFIERGTLDADGVRHSAKMVWRALAILQLELEAEGAPVARGAKLPEGK